MCFSIVHVIILLLINGLGMVELFQLTSSDPYLYVCVHVTPHIVNKINIISVERFANWIQ